LRDRVGGEGAEGHEAMDGALTLEEGVIQAQFVS
jgi:hypothetical protein